jgi:hypothetical protein
MEERALRRSFTGAYSSGNQSFVEVTCFRAFEAKRNELIYVQLCAV